MVGVNLSINSGVAPLRISRKIRTSQQVGSCRYLEATVNYLTSRWLEYIRGTVVLCQVSSFCLLSALLYHNTE